MSPALSRRLIGIAIFDDRWELAEVAAAGPGGRSTRTSTFMPPANWSDQAAACGEALAIHLKAEGYAARTIAFGLSNKHLFARRRELPVTPSDNARRGVLRLAIEKEHPDRRLAFDYLDIDDPAETSPDVLVVGVNDRTLDQLREVCKAANRKLAGVTSTALARLTLEDRPADAGHQLWVHADADGLDLVESLHGQASALGRLSLHTRPAADVLGAHLAQQELSTSDDFEVALSMDTQSDDRDESLIDGLRDRFNVRTFEATPTAESVAAALLTRSESLVNFTSSRLAAERQPAGGRYRRPTMLAGAALLVAIVGVAVWAFLSTQRNDALQAEYDQIKPRADALQTVRDHTAQAAPWFTQRPETLSALGTVTECFPREGRVWVTGLRLRDTGEGSLKGRADSKPTMLACLEAMQNHASLGDVQLRDWNQADRNSGIVGFEIVFVHQPAGGSS